MSKKQIEGQTEIIICDCCGEVIAEDEEKYELPNGKFICGRCYENDYITCEDCGEVVPLDEATCVAGEYVCQNCLDNHYWYFQCENCDEWHNSRVVESYEVWNGGTICENCYNSGDYSVCYDCDRLMHIDDMDYDENDELYYCPDCYTRRNRKYIKSYSYKPTPVFKTVHDVFFDRYEGSDMTFGVELEVDKGRDPGQLARDLCENFEDVYCKHDGSLTEDGVEIVTHPCTLEYHRESLGWDELTKMCLREGFRSQDAGTCGLHVHVGRKQMGKNEDERDATAAKMVLLVDRHWQNLVKFTRRRESQLSHWARRPDVDHSLSGEEEIVRNARRTVNDGRYQAVNLCNRSTVELRMFNGTLKTNTILASLEMASNLAEFAKDKTVKEVLNSKWDELVEYKHYEELHDYLVERGIVEEELPERIITHGTQPSPIIASFRVGDRVRVVNSEPRDEASFIRSAYRFIGLEGTIVSIHEHNNPPIGVRFDEHRTGMHNMCGELTSDTGYFLYPHNLELVEPRRCVGDMVEVGPSAAMVGVTETGLATIRTIDDDDETYTVQMAASGNFWHVGGRDIRRFVAAGGDTATVTVRAASTGEADTDCIGF